MKFVPAACLAFLFSITTTPAQLDLPKPPVRIQVRETAGRSRAAVVPCRVSFPRGTTTDPSRSHRVTDRGRVPAQTWTVATRWRDGSARDTIATVGLFVLGGQTAQLEVEAAQPPVLPPAITLDLGVKRLLPQAEGEPWFEIVSEVEDYEGTIYRARLQPDPSWKHAVREPLVEHYRFRSHHEALGSKLDRDLLALTGWATLRLLDPHVSLELCLGNDYPGTLAGRVAPPGATAKSHPDSFPLGGPIFVRRWSIRMRGLVAAVQWDDLIGVAHPISNLGWTQLDLLPARPSMYAIADGQRVVRRLRIAPLPRDASAADREHLLEDLRRELLHPIRGNQDLASLRASDSFGLLGHVGPPSQPAPVLERLAHARREGLAKNPDGGPLGAFGYTGFLRQSARPLAPSADLHLWHQGQGDALERALVPVFQGLANHPYHLLDLSAFRSPSFLGGTLSNRVPSSTYGPWKTPPDRTEPSSEPAGRRQLAVQPDDALEAWFATRSPFLRDELSLMLHQAVCAARPAHMLEPALEAQFLHTATVLNRLERDARITRHFEERFRTVVLPAMNAQGKTPYVYEHAPAPTAFGNRVTWGSSTQASHFLTACLEAFDETGSEVYWQAAVVAGRFLVSCWFQSSSLRGLARRLPLRQRGARGVWYTREQILDPKQTAPPQPGAPGDRVPWSERLEVSLDEEAALAAAPLYLLADLLEARTGGTSPQDVPDPTAFARRLRSIAQALERAAPPDQPARGILVGTMAAYQSVRDRETRDHLDLDVLPNPRGDRQR